MTVGAHGLPRADLRRVRHIVCVTPVHYKIEPVLSSERSTGVRAKARTQSGRRSRQLWVAFFKFCRGGRRSRIVFLEVFARWPLILSDDNNKHGEKHFI